MQLVTSSALATADYEALLIEPDWQSPKDTLDTDQVLVQSPGLPTWPESLSGGKTLWKQGFSWRLDGFEAMRAFLDHEIRYVGQVRSFWMPSWLTDFTVVQDVTPPDTNRIYARPEGFDFVYQQNRYGLLLVDHRDEGHLYHVVGYDPTPGIVYVQGSVEVTTLAHQVRLCSLVRRVRLDVDRITWTFKTANVAEVKLSVSEVLDEGVFL